jgi:hypothetical protein
VSLETLRVLHPHAPLRRTDHSVSVAASSGLFASRCRCHSRKMAGMTARVSTVALTIPPTIGAAIRRITSEPVPLPSIIGRRPAIMMGFVQSMNCVFDGEAYATLLIRLRSQCLRHWIFTNQVLVLKGRMADLVTIVFMQNIYNNSILRELQNIQTGYTRILT